MCTIVVVRPSDPARALLIAANRDEFYARPSTAPRVLVDRPRVVGGRDETRGGTWMGVTPTGFFVGITNQRTYGPSDPTLASRGEVVLEALKRGSTDAVRAQLRALDAAAYNPFNLIFGDRAALWVAYARRDPVSLAIEPVPHGLQVLPNDVLNSALFSKVARVRGLLDAQLDAPDDALSPAMERVLADHALTPLEETPHPPAGSPMTLAFAQSLSAICVHTATYGTRSATTLALRTGRVERYRFAAGPSCVTPWVDVTSRLDG